MRLIAKVIALMAVILTTSFGAFAKSQNDTTSTRPAVNSRLTASLITCYPGPEVYELCGHEALRIRGVDQKGLPVDSVWNYGVFDFNSPNFIYRFVKGETDYMVLGYPFEWFLPEYRERGSKVVEQDLNLTQEEVERLRKMLQTNSLPQNREYRYNYVRDNCATRIVAMVDSAAGAEIVYPVDTKYTSFRDAMRHFHQGYPWYQFGIDLALGSGIDTRITSRDEMFAPVAMKDKVDMAHYADGRKLVKKSRVLVEQHGNPVLPPTPFWLSPLAVALLVMLISVAVAVYDWKRQTLTKWWFTIFYAILGIAGCVIWFLVFISSHYATSPNILALWLSPLQLLIPAMIWWRNGRPIVTAMIWINIIMTVLLLLVWPFQPQAANPAFFPVMAADLALCAGYILSGSQLRPQPKVISMTPRAPRAMSNSSRSATTRKTTSGNKNRRKNVR